MQPIYKQQRRPEGVERNVTKCWQPSDPKISWFHTSFHISRASIQHTIIVLGKYTHDLINRLCVHLYQLYVNILVVCSSLPNLSQSGHIGPQSASHKTFNTYLFGFVPTVQIVPFQEPDLTLRPHHLDHIPRPSAFHLSYVIE